VYVLVRSVVTAMFADLVSDAPEHAVVPQAWLEIDVVPAVGVVVATSIVRTSPL
jgi:hypothetical protein